MAPTPQVKVFKCRHKDCVFRNRRNFVDHACEYAAMTGRTRTRVDKPADTANCTYYVPLVKMPRRRGYSLTGPVWESVAISLSLAGYTPAEIAQIVSVSTASVTKALENRQLPAKDKPKTYLSGFDWTRAKELYDEGMPDYKIAAVIGCSKTRVRQWREAHGLPTKHPKGEGGRQK